MIADNLVQADLISKLKSIVAVTNLLGDGISGIKELEWQGDDFKYPCVRLDLENVGYEFDEQENCGLYFCEFSVILLVRNVPVNSVARLKDYLKRL